MKSTFYIALAVLALGFASCKKEDVKPVTQPASTTQPAAPQQISVEYKVYAVSGKFKMTYLAPVGDKLVEQDITINKMQHSVTFDFMTGNKFKVEAMNVNPSTDEITVEVYVNGNLYRSGYTNSVNGSAMAEAMVY